MPSWMLKLLETKISKKIKIRHQNFKKKIKLGTETSRKSECAIRTSRNWISSGFWSSSFRHSSHTMVCTLGQSKLFFFFLSFLIKLILILLWILLIFRNFNKDVDPFTKKEIFQGASILHSRKSWSLAHTISWKIPRVKLKVILLLMNLKWRNCTLLS